MLKRMPPNGKSGKRHNGNGGKNGKNGARIKELPKITIHTDTREILAHAAKEKRGDYFIVDVDAHVTETAFWSEVIDRMDSDVYRQMARAFKDRGGSPPGLVQPPMPRVPRVYRAQSARALFRWGSSLSARPLWSAAPPT